MTIRTCIHILLVLGSFSNASCHASREYSDRDLAPNKTLIVYLSRTNNTKAVAEIIQSKVGGELVALELVEPYPENYQAIVNQVARENDTGYLPPLKAKINIDLYDTIFIGFPTWGMQLPPPMKSFLKAYDFSEKVIIPFNTNAGYGIGSSFDTVKRLAPQSEILDGYSTQGGIERDGVYYVMEGDKRVEVKEEVSEWLAELGILK
ncbi:MAG: flavodoxin [Rickettsiales bacterium]|nr:flavodoxin [Rickettsiales bacterium]